MVIGLANSVLGRMFGTREREVERYVTGIVCLEEIVLGDWIEGGREGFGGIVCLEEIVLGGLDKRWEGKGVGELCVESRLC